MNLQRYGCPIERKAQAGSELETAAEGGGDEAMQRRQDDVDGDRAPRPALNGAVVAAPTITFAS
jgi:hypothetical protein